MFVPFNSGSLSNLQDKVVYTKSGSTLSNSSNYYTIKEDGTYFIVAAVGGLWAYGTGYYDLYINGQKTNTLSYSSYASTAGETMAFFLGELKANDTVGFYNNYSSVAGCYVVFKF